MNFTMMVLSCSGPPMTTPVASLACAAPRRKPDVHRVYRRAHHRGRGGPSWVVQHALFRAALSLLYHPLYSQAALCSIERECPMSLTSHLTDGATPIGHYLSAQFANTRTSVGEANATARCCCDVACCVERKGEAS